MWPQSSKAIELKVKAKLYPWTLFQLPQQISPVEWTNHHECDTTESHFWPDLGPDISVFRFPRPPDCSRPSSHHLPAGRREISSPGQADQAPGRWEPFPGRPAGMTKPPASGEPFPGQEKTDPGREETFPGRPVRRTNHPAGGEPFLGRLAGRLLPPARAQTGSVRICSDADRTARLELIAAINGCSRRRLRPSRPARGSHST